MVKTSAPSPLASPDPCDAGQPPCRRRLRCAGTAQDIYATPSRSVILTPVGTAERRIWPAVEILAILKFSDHGENVRDRHRFSRHYVDGSSTCAIEATGLVVDETKAPVRCIGPNGR